MLRDRLLGVALVLGIAMTAVAPLCAQNTLQISLGVRETGSMAPIGTDGGTAGALEWVDIDNQVLILDGTWQLFFFDLDVQPISGFTGNGVLDGNAGTLEHIRVRNHNGLVRPITLWVDEISDITTSLGTTTFGTFEGSNPGAEVMFKAPGFSGTTLGNLLASPDSAGVDATVAYAGVNSYRFEFQFVDADPTKWVRLTTFQPAFLPNPTIAFNDDSIVQFYLRGEIPLFDNAITCQPNPTGPGASVTFDIVAGNPNHLVYHAMTTLNPGQAPNGWFFGVNMSISEIQYQLAFGSPFFVLLDGTGASSFTIPLPGIVCPLGISIDAIPLEFSATGGSLTQMGIPKTFML